MKITFSNNQTVLKNAAEMCGTCGFMPVYSDTAYIQLYFNFLDNQKKKKNTAKLVLQDVTFVPLSNWLLSLQGISVGRRGLQPTSISGAD